MLFRLYSLLPLYEKGIPLKEDPEINSVGLHGYLFSSGKCHCITINTHKKKPILYNAETDNSILLQLIKDLRHCFVPLTYCIIASPAHLPEHDWLDEKVFEVKKIVTTLKNNMSQIIKPYLQEDVQKIWTTGFEDKVLYTEKEYEECVNTLKSNAATVHKTSCFCDMAK